MDNFKLILIFSLLLVGCSSSSSSKPKICEIKSRFNKVVLKTRSNDCGKKQIILKSRKEIDFVYDGICKSESIFILNKQGDIWYVDIFIDGFEKKLLTLTKTVLGTYYFRDKLGTYSNDELAKRISELMEVECDGNNGNGTE